MSRNYACLCLTLVLFSSWAISLMSHRFSVAPPNGNASFGQEVYPLAMQHRAEARASIEAPPLARLASAPVSIRLIALSAICSGFEDSIPRILSGPDVCYVHMSLQR